MRQIRTVYRTLFRFSISLHAVKLFRVESGLDGDSDVER
jgi:hypothetical protein